jgi:hypothetical protein
MVGPETKTPAGQAGLSDSRHAGFDMPIDPGGMRAQANKKPRPKPRLKSERILRPDPAAEGQWGKADSRLWSLVSRCSSVVERERLPRVRWRAWKGKRSCSHRQWVEYRRSRNGQLGSATTRQASLWRMSSGKASKRLRGYESCRSATFSRTLTSNERMPTFPP